MKTRFLQVVLTALLLTGCCSPRSYLNPGECDITCINIIDKNGFSETHSNPDRIKQYANVDFLTPQPYQKVLRIFGRDSHGDVKACISSYHDNGQVKQYLEVVNNRAFGTYKEWYANGVLKMEANVIGGMADLTVAAERSWLFESTNTVWDEQGNLEAEIVYSKGELEGYSTYYHKNGHIWKLVPFQKGEIHGTFEVHLDDGQLLLTIEYCQGVKHGQSYRYWDDECIAFLETFSDGLLCEAQYYDSNGTLVSEIKNGNGYKVLFGKKGVSEKHQYISGIQEGEVQLYTENGRMFSTHYVKEGVKHGKEVEYYNPLVTGKPKLPKISLGWYEGIIQGQVKTWYANAVQESQREMSKNKKNGISTAWYRDGSLMMIEEYDMDKLVKGQYYKMGERVPTSKVAMGSGTVSLYDSEGNYIKKVHYNNGIPED